MALITSAASGNFNAGATWTGGVVPGVGDEARASTGHTITITANVTCDEVSNAGTGIFTLNDGVTLTANVTNKSTTNSRSCVQFTAAAPATASIVGNCTAGPASISNAVIHSSTGTLNVTGNLFAGALLNNYAAISFTGSGILNVTGNITGGAGSTSIGLYQTGNGTLNITGNCTGGAGIAATGLRVDGAAATVTVIGIATGGAGGSQSAGIQNSNTATIIAQRAVGNEYGPGNTSGFVGSSPGVASTGAGVVEVTEIVYGTYGASPTNGSGIRLKKLSSNVAVFNYADTAGAKTLVDATTGQMPAATDVRDGVSYASGALTGSCKVPAAASVGFGVPVDATTGTAALTPASVWDHLLTAITTSSTIGTLLKTNIDATISSRSTATTAGIADAVWDEVLNGSNHNIASSAGRRLRILDEERIIADGQVVSATTSGVTVQPLGNLCSGQTIIVTNQTNGEKQTRFILSFDTATDTASVDSPWTTIPTAGDEYLLTTVRDPLVTRGDHPTGTVGAEIDEMYLIHGLKDGEVLTVTPTSRTAGAISQTIGGDGATTTTVSRD
jgi:hypothetical protein